MPAREGQQQEDFEETHGKVILRVRCFTHPDGCKYFNVMVGHARLMPDGKQVFSGALRMGDLEDAGRALSDFRTRMVAQESANLAIKRQKSAEYKAAVSDYQNQTNKRLGKKGRKRLERLTAEMKAAK